MKILKKIFLFIIKSAILLIMLIGYSRYIEPNLMVTKKIDIKSTSDMAIKIVFFSDTHFGNFYSQNKIEEIAAKINKENADIVIFGGDFLDAYNRDSSLIDLDYISNQLSSISAKYGKFAVWGNHDYGGGSSRIYKSVMSDGGFELLKNSSVTIEELNLTLTGLDDFLLGNPDTSMVIANTGSFNVLISHAPDIVDDMNLKNIDFILAGHSHGGQVSLPIITDKILPPGARKYKKGMYDFDSAKGTKLFVSKGLGTTNLPYRFMNVPEIVVIDVMD